MSMLDRLGGRKAVEESLRPQIKPSAPQPSKPQPAPIKQDSTSFASRRTVDAAKPDATTFAARRMQTVEPLTDRYQELKLEIHNRIVNEMNPDEQIILTRG